MRIRTSLLLLLSIVFNIIIICVSKFNFFYVFTLIILLISEGVLIYEIITQIKGIDSEKLVAKEEIKILSIASAMGYDIRFEGDEHIVVNLYYNDEFITTLVRHSLDFSLYYINGLLEKTTDIGKDKILIDVNSLTMRLCKYKTNPNLYIKGDKNYGYTNLME